MKRKVRIVGDKVLRKVAEPVSRITPDLSKLISDMFETMKESNGIGLAAPQVGVSKRVIVISVPMEDEGVHKAALINPEIAQYSVEEDIVEEGCLSVPGVVAEVKRPVAIKVRAIDGIKKKKTNFEAEGLLARCIMHEIDHLDGKLFIDRAGISEKEAAEIISKKKVKSES